MPSDSSLPDYIRPYSGQLEDDQITNSTFELAAWPGNTDKRLPTISFVMFSVFVLSLLLQIILILCHDSEAAKCLSDSVVAPAKGRRGIQ